METEIKKKRTRRTAAELLKETEEKAKRLKAKAKAENDAKKQKIARQVLAILEKELGRDISAADLPYFQAFLIGKEEAYKAAMER